MLEFVKKQETNVTENQKSIITFASLKNDSLCD